MSLCTDPKCTSITHAHSPLSRGRAVVIPISDEDAKIIDDARRALLSRITSTDILPPTQNLNMTTRVVDIPPGTHEIEIHYILVEFSDEMPVRRARVSTMLSSHFGYPIKVEQAEQDNVWLYAVFGDFRIEFQVLAEIHDAIAAISSGKVNFSRIQGLHVTGLFSSEQASDGTRTFTLSGDHENNNPWLDAA